MSGTGNAIIDVVNTLFKGKFPKSVRIYMGRTARHSLSRFKAVLTLLLCYSVIHRPQSFGQAQ